LALYHAATDGQAYFATASEEDREQLQKLLLKTSLTMTLLTMSVERCKEETYWGEDVWVGL